MITDSIKAWTDTAGLHCEQTALEFGNCHHMIYTVPKHKWSKSILSVFHIVLCILWLRTESQSDNSHSREEK